MPFFCQQCGECCTEMGYVHVISAECGNHEYLIRNEYTGELTRSRVAAGMLHRFEDRSVFDRWPHACPFFRYDDGEQKGYCTVYPTWPEICQEYKCWRLLILDAQGRRAGRVMTGTYIACEDEILRTIWDYHIRDLDVDDQEFWTRSVVRTLRRFGYTVLR